MEHSGKGGRHLAEAGQLGVTEVMCVVHGRKVENEEGGGWRGLANNITALDNSGMMKVLYYVYNVL